MSTTAIIIILCGSLVASFIQRVTGFGFAVFIMTLLPFLMPSYGEATTLSGLLAMVNACWTTIQLRKHIAWKKLSVILVTFLIVSFFCVSAVGRIDSHSARKILGGVLIALSIYFFFFSGKIRLKPSVGVQIPMGMISGTMGGFFAMQGPAAVVYFLSCADTKEEYMSLISCYLLLGNIAMTAFRAGNGMFTATVGKMWLAAVPIVILGNLIGRKLYSRLAMPSLKKIIYAYMALAGVAAIVL